MPGVVLSSVCLYLIITKDLSHRCAWSTETSMLIFITGKKKFHMPFFSTN